MTYEVSLLKELGFDLGNSKVRFGLESFLIRKIISTQARMFWQDSFHSLNCKTKTTPYTAGN